MKEKFTITIDPTPQKKKPAINTIGTISNRLTVVTAMTITDISKILVQPYSYTWSPAVFNSSRSNNTWVQQEVFALDFDSGITPDEVKSRFNKIGITPNLFYSTFSDTLEKRKFRVLIFIDETIDDIEFRNHIIQSLMELFPECDKHCKDPGRMFFGGLLSEVWNPDPIGLNNLVDSLLINKIPADHRISTKQYKKRLFLLYYYKSKRKCADSSTEISGPDLPEYLSKIKRNLFDWDKCKDRVKIFNDFIEGKWLSHPELFGLATNLQWINGGLKKMKEAMEKYNQLGLTNYSINNFKILPYVRYMEYQPQNLKNFSSNPEDHEHTNLITAVTEVRGHVEIIKPPEWISLDEGRRLFNNYFELCLKSNERKIYICKVPTGIGKTEMLTNLPINTTIALPTHDLKDEVSQRMNTSHIVTPEIPKFGKPQLNKHIKNLYTVGLYKNVYQQIQMISKDATFKFNNKSDVELANKFLNELNRCDAWNGTLLTTHKRSLLKSYSNDTLIFDEDPFNSLIEIKQFKISDLFKLEFPFGYESNISKIRDYLLKCPAEVIAQTPTFNIDIDKLMIDVSESKITSNVLGFFKSLYFIKSSLDQNTIHYVIKNTLPTDKKIIILSATVPIKFYQYLYGDRVEYIDLSNIKHQGTIIQHTKLSCSRQGLNKYYGKILIQLNGEQVLTLKDFSEIFSTDDLLHIHFGNCEGFDVFKGKNINVVGTPHFNNIVYLLYGKILGIEFNTLDTSMKYQMIEWKERKFKFNTFNHEELRDLQLTLIESQILQAVGRARTLITDATVNLYSNLPLLISNEFRY